MEVVYPSLTYFNGVNGVRQATSERSIDYPVAVDEDGNGVLREGRLYQLVREREAIQQRTLKITFHEPGAEAYAFTFG